MFVWQFVDNITEEWHRGGGVLVIAENEGRARAMIATASEEGHAREGGPDYMGESPKVYLLADDWGETITIFPDAGCC